MWALGSVHSSCLPRHQCSLGLLRGGHRGHRPATDSSVDRLQGALLVPGEQSVPPALLNASPSPASLRLSVFLLPDQCDSRKSHSSLIPASHSTTPSLPVSQPPPPASQPSPPPPASYPPPTSHSPPLPPASHPPPATVLLISPGPRPPPAFSLPPTLWCLFSTTESCRCPIPPWCLVPATLSPLPTSPCTVSTKNKQTFIEHQWPRSPQSTEDPRYPGLQQVRSAAVRGCSVPWPGSSCGWTPATPFS